MTQEEKAKNYDIALDKIKRLLGTGSNCSREELEYVFPELKESEDEKIRKDIVAYLKSVIANKGYRDKIIESWIAWLEKQGEQGANGNEREIPNSTWSEEDERCLTNAIDACKQMSDEDYDYSQGYIDAINWLKSLKERYTWKPSNEQMGALNDVISSRDIKYDVLSELWKDLKKLRKE